MRNSKRLKIVSRSFRFKDMARSVTCHTDVERVGTLSPSIQSPVMSQGGIAYPSAEDMLYCWHETYGTEDSGSLRGRLDGDGDGRSA